MDQTASAFANQATGCQQGFGRGHVHSSIAQAHDIDACQSPMGSRLLTAAQQWLCVGLLLLLAVTADASRRYVPMGVYIQQAELIVLADVQESDYRSVELSVKRVLKGDKDYQGKHINMVKGGGLWASTEVSIPEGKNVAILFKPNWRQSEMKFWPITEVYVDDEIPPLKKLIKLLRKGDERQRIKQLIKWFPTAHYEIQQQLFEALEHRTNQASFDLFYPAFEAMVTDDDHYDLMRLVEESNDPQAVPFMIQLLDHASEDVREDAAHALFYHYPGFAGIAEAFERHWDDLSIRDYTQPYLAARYRHPKYQQPDVEPTPWQQAQKLTQAGQHQAASVIYLEYMQQANVFGSQVRYATEALPGISAAGRQLLVEQIFQTESDSAEQNQRNALALIALINQGDWSIDEVQGVLLQLLQVNHGDHRVFPKLVLTIKKLGGELVTAAVESLIEQVPNQPPGTIRPQLGLAYLAADPIYAEQTAIDGQRRSFRWSKAANFRAVMQAEDPTGELIALVHSLGPSNTPGWVEWLLVHLAAHDDPRVVPALLEYWRNRQHYGSHQIMPDVLLHRQDERLNGMLIEMLSEVNEAWTMYTVTELIIQRMQEQALPHLRRIIKRQLPGNQGLAFRALGRLGAKQDLDLLRQFCDMNDDQIKQNSVACEALRLLRKKHGFDAQGKIIKTNHMTPLDD